MPLLREINNLNETFTTVMTVNDDKNNRQLRRKSLRNGFPLTGLKLENSRKERKMGQTPSSLNGGLNEQGVHDVSPSIRNQERLRKERSAFKQNTVQDEPSHEPRSSNGISNHTGNSMQTEPPDEAKSLLNLFLKKPVAKAESPTKEAQLSPTVHPSSLYLKRTASGEIKEMSEAALPNISKKKIGVGKSVSGFDQNHESSYYEVSALQSPTAQNSKDESNMDPEKGREALKAKLISMGVNNDQVDDLIIYCETEELSGTHDDDLEESLAGPANPGMLSADSLAALGSQQRQVLSRANHKSFETDTPRTSTQLKKSVDQKQIGTGPKARHVGTTTLINCPPSLGSDQSTRLGAIRKDKKVQADRVGQDRIHNTARISTKPTKFTKSKHRIRRKRSLTDIFDVIWTEIDQSSSSDAFNSSSSSSHRDIKAGSSQQPRKLTMDGRRSNQKEGPVSTTVPRSPSIPASHPQAQVIISLPVPASSKSKTNSRLDHFLQITKEPLTSTTNLDNATRRPYRHKERRDQEVHKYKRHVSDAYSSRINKVLHVDFDIEEMETVLSFVSQKSRLPTKHTDMAIQDQLIFALDQLSSTTRSVILNQISQMSLPCRRPRDIAAKLKDAENGCLATSPSILRVQISKSIPTLPSHPQRPQLLLCRSLGLRQHRGASRAKEINGDLRERAADGLRPWKRWTGASHDILNVTWSPDGNRYAAGAAALTDPLNMQYNRGNNLLLGDLISNSLRELPDHHIARPPPEDIETGPNALHDTYVTSDPTLYMTVSAVKWSGFTDHLFTASYDKAVKIWDVTRHSNAHCIKTLDHEAEVEVIALSAGDRLLATGANNSSSLRVYDIQGGERESEDSLTYNVIPFGKSMKGRKTEPRFNPSSLTWGSTPETQDLLLAGFTIEEMEDTHSPPVSGHLGLWKVREGDIVKLDVSPNSQNIFDSAWHPTLPYFATGSVPPLLSRNSGTRSIVRVYEPLNSVRAIVEYDCPALDMNEVTFCPFDNNIITASCTDGVTYVWDFRNCSQILHQLRHGKPIVEPIPYNESYLTREQQDVGIRLALWGDSGNNRIFYTGATDGVLKTWNILLAPEDVHVQNVTTFDAGIMCGSFSPDKTNLLIGDARGSIHVLTTASMTAYADEEGDGIGDIKFDWADGAGPDTNTNTTATESGIEIARELLTSGQLTMHPVYGAGKGPNYPKPYAVPWASKGATLEADHPFGELSQKVQAMQLDEHRANIRAELTEEEKRFVDIQREIARYRNRRFREKKRTEVDPDPETPEEQKPKIAKPLPAKKLSSHPEVISLLSDDEDEISTPTIVDLTSDNEREVIEKILVPRKTLVGKTAPVGGRHGLPKMFEENREEKLTEDHWFPPHSMVGANFGGDGLDG